MMALSEPVIRHLRDTLQDVGGIAEQDYGYRVHGFGDGGMARTYLDAPTRVAVTRPGPMPETMLAYLRARFDVIDQLGPTGYQTIWTA